MFENFSLKMQMVIQNLDSVWLPEYFFLAVFFFLKKKKYYIFLKEYGSSYRLLGCISAIFTLYFSNSSCAPRVQDKTKTKDAPQSQTY